jgi:hypothetical protein
METKRRTVACLLLVFCMSMALADEDHYVNVFIGDRAAGLAGAYTAIADGPEGAYYNPAGLAFSSSKYFSLSANAIQYKQLTYRNIWPDAPNRIDYNRYSISFIPNFFGFLQKARNFTFAITVSSPDSEFYDQRDKLTLPQNAQDGSYLDDMNLNVNLNLIDQLFEVGPSFAFRPHRMVAVGFGLFLRYRDKKLIYSNTSSLEHYHFFETSNLYFSERIIGLKPQFGVQVMPMDKLSIGYNVSFPLDIVGIYNYQNTYFSYYDDQFSTLTGISKYNFNVNKNIQDNQISVLSIFQGSLLKPTTLHQSLGVAYFISKSVLVSTDVSLYLPFYTPLANAPVFWKRWPTWNLAVGIEWYITPNFPLRCGFFTNNTSVPPIAKSYEPEPADYVNLYGGSLTLGYTTSDFGVNFGGTFSYGRGEAKIISGIDTVQVLDAFQFNVFISGGYQF